MGLDKCLDSETVEMAQGLKHLLGQSEDPRLNPQHLHGYQLEPATSCNSSLGRSRQRIPAASGGVSYRLNQ